VVNVAEMPIKCPVAPLEFLFLADAFFTQRGMRDKVEIVYATPLEGAFTKPRASAALGDMLAKRNIDVLGDFSSPRSTATSASSRPTTAARQLRPAGVDPAPRRRGGDPRSGMGDAGGWLPTDKHTLQSKCLPNVFASATRPICPRRRPARSRTSSPRC
jgi:sulfide:quinone oxidoreductase